jgi:hypothetical protein
VSPAKRAEKQRDSVCEQCHLEGVTTILNPGKDWWNFKPGEPLEETQAAYVLRGGENETTEVAAVSHLEQLALSACKRANPGKLWCATCHDPHSPAGDHEPEISRVCRTCHARLQLSTSHRRRNEGCVGCHMPKLRATDISHAPSLTTVFRNIRAIAGDPVGKHRHRSWLPGAPRPLRCAAGPRAGDL